VINTFSKFYYGITVTSDQKYLDFDEGSGEVTAVVQTGSYTLDDLAIAVEDAMNLVGVNTYSVLVDRATRKLTIESDSPIDFLAGTGTNVGLNQSIYPTLGYPETDELTSDSYQAADAIGLVYSPQYKLQDYVDAEDYQTNRNGTVSTSASGKVQLQSFGIDRMFEFSIKFATGIRQNGFPIRDNPTGVEDLRSFMQWCMNKSYVEFMPDEDDPDNFYRLVLENAPGGSSGTGYKLQEQFLRGLVGYYESGVLTFRIIED